MSAREQVQEKASWQYVQSPQMDAMLFRQWVELLELRTGISLPETRKTFLVTNLHTRMRELGIADYKNYFDLITDGTRGQVEWEILVDRLTVHETRFYRDASALELIEKQYLEPLVNKVSAPYTVQAWSVGCATGEEPYSLAMLLDSYLLKHQSEFYFGVTASDVSRASLKTGRDAIYHERRVKNVPQAITEQYLQRVDEHHVQVSEAIRQKVCFTRINLLQLDSQPLCEMDIILCQNVLIYFKQELRIQILEQLVSHLKPGGLLILGAGEVFSWEHPDLETVKSAESNLAFRRRYHREEGSA